MEYSFLSSWAANELSTVQDIKGIQKYYGIMDILVKGYNLDYSDERLRQIETLLKTLTDTEPSIIDTPNVEPLLDVFKSFNNKYITK
jgi:hypothetical protein